MAVRTRGRLTRAQVIDRRTQVVELTRTGLSDDQIAQQLGYANRSGVWKARRRALEATLSDSVAEYRALEVSRLDALQDALWDKATSGDVGAVGQIRQIVMARARLLGILSGKPRGKPSRPEAVVQQAFWDHAGSVHAGDWRSCRCPEIMGVVDEDQFAW